MKGSICKECALFPNASDDVCKDCPHISLTGRECKIILLILAGVLACVIAGAYYF